MRISSFDDCIYHDFAYDEIFICALGYESRSFYLLQRNIITRDSGNTLIICFDDFDMSTLPCDVHDYIMSNEIPLEICPYDGSDIFPGLVLEFLNKVMPYEGTKHIHVDYSSMPRNWYCNLPKLLEASTFAPNIRLVFWYVAGEYPAAYESYPTAGIDCFNLFWGGSLPEIDAQRTHIIALSYDVTRTQGILSIVEPDFLVVCYAYNSNNRKDEIEYVNADIVRRAAVSVALPMNSFVYMLNKLNEMILEQTNDGQVVLIPDGPKPLIFAMSLVSMLVDVDDGITCLHIKRNNRIPENKVNVSAREDEIFGVSMRFISATLESK